MRRETVDFWKKQLDGAIPWLSLPKDRKMTKDTQPVMERLDDLVNADLVHGLERLAGEHGVGLSTILLAAFETLLFRYTGWQDLIVACFDEDRPDEPLPVRVVVNEDRSFLELLDRVEATLRQVKQHRDFPPSLWWELISSKSSERHLLPSPVRFSGSKGGRNNVDTANGGTETGNSQGELKLVVTSEESGLRLQFQYNAQLFQPATIHWMSRHYQQLLLQAVTEPNLLLDDLVLATQEELATVRQWGQGEPGPQQNQLYHERFQSQVEQRPEKEAVIFRGGLLTYRELDCRANQLAHHLQALGVGPDAVVGLLMECSPELVIANLAVFKAGGCVFLLPPALQFLATR